MEIMSLGGVQAASFIWRMRSGTWAQTIIGKLTFQLRPVTSTLIEAQEPVLLEDEHWDDDPERSLFAPTDLVPLKARADVVLVGDAFAPRGEPVRSLIARLQVADVNKAVEVVCDRAWTGDGQLRDGNRFARMPLVYERAGGGPDSRNPVGIRQDGSPDRQGRRPIPNLQPSDFLLQSPSDIIPPVGFGPIAPSWPERQERLGALAGKWPGPGWYDEPMPEGLSPRYFNVAPADQQVDAIRVNERIILENLHPEHPRLVTSLPGIMPRARLARHGRSTEPLVLRADTLWIDTNRGICVVTWRALVQLASRDELGMVTLDLPDPSAPSLQPDDDGVRGLTPPHQKQHAPALHFGSPSTPAALPPPPRPSVPSHSDAIELDSPDSEVELSDTDIHEASVIRTLSAAISARQGSAPHLKPPAPPPARSTIADPRRPLPPMVPPPIRPSPAAKPPADSPRPLPPLVPPPIKPLQTPPPPTVSVPVSATPTPTAVGPSIAEQSRVPPPSPLPPDSQRTLPQMTPLKQPEPQRQNLPPPPPPPADSSPSLPLPLPPPSSPALAPPPSPESPRTSSQPATSPIAREPLATPATPPATPPAAPPATPPAGPPAPLTPPRDKLPPPRPPADSSPAIGASTEVAPPVARAPVEPPVPPPASTQPSQAEPDEPASSDSPAPPTVADQPAQAADDSAIRIETPSSPPPAAPTPAPDTNVEPKPQRPSHFFKLLWFEPKALPAIRNHDPFRMALAERQLRLLEHDKNDSATQDAKPGDDDASKQDRHDIFEILARGQAGGVDALNLAVDQAADHDGRFEPPLVLLTGELQLPFDELETLRATVAVATPFAPGDKKLKDTTDTITDLLKLPWVHSAGSVATNLTERIIDIFGDRLGPDYLQTHTDRTLLEERRYQTRTVYGRVWIRALLHLGGGLPVPTYLPQALTNELPLFKRFKVRLLGEVDLREDQYETHPLAIRALALARIVDRGS